MEAWRAASDREGVEEHGNFKRPDLPETTPAGRQHKRSPKVEKYSEMPKTDGVLLNLQTSNDLLLPVKQTEMYSYLFFFL